jgi:uncharacterized repeat protein (TIGR02543 family)
MTPSGGVYASGTQVTLNAQPASGYAFTGWSGDVTGTANPAPVTMSANKTVEANFTSVNKSAAAHNHV